MPRKMPPIKNENRILIVCEGYEEFDYLQSLKANEVWNNLFSIDIKNAGSIDKISAVYSYNYGSGNYKLIVVFCDTEKYPYEQFLALKNKINKFHGRRVADYVVFFANPCTLQIVLSHFDKVHLTSNAKSDNADIIKKLTGVENYRATSSQRAAIMKKITHKNYVVMEKNLADLSDTYTKIPSSNALKLFQPLDSGDNLWLKSIKKKVEKE